MGLPAEEPGQEVGVQRRFACRHGFSRALQAVLVCVLIAGLAACLPAPEKIPYRAAPYKAPTPWALPGGKTLHFAQSVQALMAAKQPLLIDVSPITLSPPNAAGQRIWIQKPNQPHRHLPGSIWLPNVGYARLSPEMEAYFRRNLAQHSGGVRAKPLLFYCTADCWMSWNAAIRAQQEYAYTQVYWYPYGIDGWRQAELPLVAAQPVAFRPDP